MKFTNNKIYQIANNLSILNSIDTYIPAKANFFLQKNIQKMTAAAEDIEKSRMDIAKHYGTLDSDSQYYDIPKDKIPEVSKEMEDLFEIEQDIDIKLISIDAFGDTNFTPAQMQAIMFMIED